MVQRTASRIKTLDHTFELLEVIMRHQGAEMATIADEVDMSKSSVYKHLSTLQDLGYVVHGDNNTYDLSLNWLKFGGYARHQHYPVHHIQTAIGEIAQLTGELCLFSIRHGTSSVPIYHARGEHAVTTDSYIGLELPLHCTASGKAMLAALGDEADPILDQLELTPETDSSVTERDDLEAELEAICERGYSLEDQERIKGMRGIGTAVRNEHTHELIGAIAITGPVHRIDDEQFREKLPELIANRAREMGINITYETS